MNNWSRFVIFDVPRTSSKTMIFFLYSRRGFISSLISVALTSEMIYCSGGDLVIIKISRAPAREKILTYDVFRLKRKVRQSMVYCCLTVYHFPVLKDSRNALWSLYGLDQNG